MSEEKIIEFKKIMLNTINSIDSDIEGRDREIAFKDVIYYSSYLIGKNESYSSVNIHLKHKNILDVSDDALIKKRGSISSVYFKKVNDSLLDYIYKDQNRRILAVDGTNITLLKCLSKFNLKINDTGNYCSALISSLIDVEREILINYNLCVHKDERLALRKQFCYLREGDILIMDRGYFSYDLLYELYMLGVKPLFR